MTQLVWDTAGERFYETGVDRGVLYLDNEGFSWSGLISVQENSSGGDPQPYYVDGYKYANLASSEEFEATIEAFSAPSQFSVCDGNVELYNGLTITQQRRRPFGLSYRTKIGNDTGGVDHGYKIHLVYNALAAPSDRNNRTIQDSPEPTVLNWAITTKPPRVSALKPSAHFVIDTRNTDPGVLSDLEDLLYGTESTTPEFPTPEELIALFS